MTLSGPTGAVAAAGTVAGADHVAAFRDNQDGFALRREGGWTIAVVTDGCSSTPASDLGARLGALAIARAAARRLPAAPAEGAAAAIADDLARAMAAAARMLGGDPARARAVLADAFLFGWLCAAIGPERAVVLGQGDGAFAVDGAVTTIDPGPDNAPPYPAYALLDVATPGPRVHVDLPASRIARLAIATDGAAHLIGETGAVGGISTARLAKNPSLVVKALRVARTRGEIRDDATCAVIARGAP